MQEDFRESLLVICKNDMSEYEILKRASCSEFLTRYKLFIDEIEVKKDVKKEVKNGNG